MFISESRKTTILTRIFVFFLSVSRSTFSLPSFLSLNFGDPLSMCMNYSVPLRCNYWAVIHPVLWTIHTAHYIYIYIYIYTKHDISVFLYLNCFLMMSQFSPDWWTVVIDALLQEMPDCYLELCCNLSLSHSFQLIVYNYVPSSLQAK